ncbi:MAG: hypothetical protein ACK56I_09590, partial [bacterium]
AGHLARRAGARRRGGRRHRRAVHDLLLRLAGGPGHGLSPAPLAAPPRATAAWAGVRPDPVSVPRRLPRRRGRAPQLHGGVRHDAVVRRPVRHQRDDPPGRDPPGGHLRPAHLH